MPGDIPEAAETEEVISEEAQVPESTVEESTTPDEPQTEKPLTADDYRKIAREEATRVAQSQTAKSENRIQKYIDEQFKALDATKGVLNLSDEQVKQARREIVASAYEQPQQEEETDPQQTQASVDQQAEYVHSQIAATLLQHGVDSINPNDPEFKGLDAAFNDPNGSFAKVILAANEAAKGKAARIAQKKGNAAARVGSGGTTQSTTQTPKTAEEKISAGLNREWQSEEPRK